MTANLKIYDDVPFDLAEALRYAGIKSSSDDFVSLIQSALNEARPLLSYKVAYVELQCSDLPDCDDLRQRVQGIDKVVAFVATVGIGIDRLIKKYGELSPVKALAFQALGAERTESLCNAFCDGLKKAYAPLDVGARFSPGYGKLPLDLQKFMFDVTDCTKLLGVTLTDSLIMSPSKSVTAFVPIGISSEGGCKACKTDCAFRR